METQARCGVIGEFFIPEDVARIEQGLPVLGDWSPDLLVPVSLRKLLNARVIWLNKRWFLSRQIDVAESSTRARVENWLLAEFGYIVPRETDVSGALGSSTRTMYADRYGTTGGLGRHGGSGRVVHSGCFQAKGVGITPLVGSGVHAGHAHGCASVEESIREAIYAEVCCEEFPHGTVPTIAIIDTGLYFSSPDTTEQFDQGVRRGISVRPATIRAAHAERAPLFKNSVTGYVNVQAVDVRRTADVVRRWLRPRTQEAFSFPTPALFISRLAEQVAFGQVHRLFNGGHYSSNISITGELLDFGNMHALPNWFSAQAQGSSVRFGSEWLIIRKLIQSLSFYFAKYCSSDQSDSEQTLANIFIRNHSFSFRRECVRILNIKNIPCADLRNRMIDALLIYFKNQQNSIARYEFGRPVGYSQSSRPGAWLHNGEEFVSQSDNEIDLFSRMKEACDSLRRTSRDAESTIRSIWVTASRFLAPRKSIDRAHLLFAIRETVKRSLGAKDSLSEVGELIKTAVDSGRRHWRRIPEDLIVEAHVYQDGCSGLICYCERTDSKVLWLEGLKIRGSFRWFDQHLTEHDLGGIPTSTDGAIWSAIVRLVPSGQDIYSGFKLTIGNSIICVPCMTVKYGEKIPSILDDVGVCRI